jgi:hypothetical protein
MGRPLKKDVFGVDVIGSFTGAPAAGVRVQFFDSELRTDGVIVKQRGAKTFKVTQVANLAGNKGKDSTSFATCVLQAAEPSAVGQMRMFGYNPGNGGDAPASQVAIRKITKRVATDFSGNRYTWKLENDSSNDYIVLTPVA